MHMYRQKSGACFLCLGFFSTMGSTCSSPAEHSQVIHFVVSAVSTRPGCFFFVVAPFCSCPASLVSRKFFAVGPGCAKCFFFVALRWAPRPFGGARAKKKHHPGCLFFCCGPGERQGKEKPRWAPARGQSKKKHHRGCFFFCCGPGEKQGKEKPRWAPARGQSKKKNTTQGVFFLLRPRGKAGEGEAPLGAGTGPEQNSGPVPASNGASPSLAFRRGRSKKKKHPGWCFFFFAAAPRGRSLTHCGPGWRCLPLAGAAFFFLLRPRPDRGGVFFFAVAPPGRSLTHGGLGRFRQGPGGVFFFAAAPPGLFRE